MAGKRFSSILCIIGGVVLIVGLIIAGKILYDAAVYFDRSNDGNGTMYVYDGSLYFGAKKCGICVYNENEGSRYIVKKADRYFAADADEIYYTYMGDCYRYQITTGETEPVDAFPEGLNIQNQTAANNSEEVKQVMYNNYDAAISDPFAILDNDNLFVAYNMAGGYIAAYKVDKGEVYYDVDMNSQKIIENSYLPFQYAVIRGTVLRQFIIGVAAVTASLVGLIVIFKMVLKNVKKTKKWS